MYPHISVAVGNASAFCRARQMHHTFARYSRWRCGLFASYWAVALAVVSTASAFTVNVSGNLQWADGQGNLHNARGIRTEVWSIDLLGTQTMEFTTNADLDGNYSGSFESLAPGLLDVYLRVYAQNSAGFVSPDVLVSNAPDPAATYFLQTPTTGVGAGANMISANFTNATDAGRAFGVVDMMLVGAQFATDVRGAALPALPARFPHSPPPTPNTSFFSSTLQSIYVLGDDRWDWDVTGHEYSHYLHNQDQLTNSPGGSHTFGVSNIPGTATNANNEKSMGARLGWSEGVGNYMGVAMQLVNPVANKFPTMLQAFGDTSYTDTIDATVDFSLEGTAGSGMAGEGEEVAVARILWDLGDAKNEAHDRVARGHVQVYKDLVAARNRVRTEAGDNSLRLATLHHVNDYYMTDVATTDQDRVDFGAIYETYTVSPHPTGALIGSTVNILADPITFDWNRQNNNASDTFRLMVWNDDLTTRLIDNFLIPGDVTTYTLTEAQKMLLKPEIGNILNFAIIGSDLLDSAGNAYAGIEATGNYWSDAYQFTVVTEPATAGLLAIGLLGIVSIRWSQRPSLAIRPRRLGASY